MKSEKYEWMIVVSLFDANISSPSSCFSYGNGIELIDKISSSYKIASGLQLKSGEKKCCFSLFKSFKVSTAVFVRCPDKKQTHIFAYCKFGINNQKLQCSYHQ